LSFRSGKIGGVSFAIIPGNIKAAKPEMFYTAEELIAREEPHCILCNTPSGKVYRKESRMDSRKVML
jgi:hypothetical protein